MPRIIRQPFDDMLCAMEPIMRVRSVWRSLVPMLLSMLITWFIYVPIHELLHVGGYVVAGGPIEEAVLEIKPMYGGHILAKYFSFVEAGGPYAGRLREFKRDDDFIYLATDFGPFILSVLFGVVLLRICAQRRRPLLFGPAVVLGAAPFYNLPGDYYEMGSIMTTRTLTLLAGAPSQPPRFSGLRSDDVFTLIGNLITDPAALGLNSAGAIVFGALLIVVCIAVSVVLAFLTYAAGDIVARATVGPGRVWTMQNR